MRGVSTSVPRTMVYAQSMSDTDSVQPPRKNVLLVEDDPELLRTLDRLLTSDGHVVTTASSEVAARAAALAAGPFAFGVLDINLTPGNGLDLAIDLRARGAIREWVLFTGGCDEETLLRAEASGVVIFKPNIDELRQKIRSRIARDSSFASAPPPRL